MGNEPLRDLQQRPLPRSLCPDDVLKEAEGTGEVPVNPARNRSAGGQILNRPQGMSKQDTCRLSSRHELEVSGQLHASAGLNSNNS
jgi:hypothetical protein